MAVGTINREFQKQREGLIYDADSVVLAGKYGDELSAHRARKHWVEVLNNYFLLEQERDYEIWVTSSLQENYFVISCCFVSACGRYAFWRLVNQQAPEAEAKLGATVRRNAGKRHVPGTLPPALPYVLSSVDAHGALTTETCSLLKRVLKFFS